MVKVTNTYEHPVSQNGLSNYRMKKKSFYRFTSDKLGRLLEIILKQITGDDHLKNLLAKMLWSVDRKNNGKLISWVEDRHS